MFNDLLLVTGLCGLTCILVRGRIFFEFRAMVGRRFPPNDTHIGYAVNCCQCVGFWVGLLGAVVHRLLVDVGSFAIAEQFLLIFMMGCTVSLLSVVFDRYIFGRV